MTTTNAQNNPQQSADEVLTKSEAVSIQAIHDFARAGSKEPQFLIDAALTADDDAVRCVAISYLQDLPTLKRLFEQPGVIAEAAYLQYHNLLAGNLSSETDHAEKIREIASLDAKSLKQIALLTKRKDAGTAAIDLITDSQDLADLCLFAASAFIRKIAAEKLVDIDQIKELIEKIGTKDKSVHKVLLEKLSPHNNVETDSSVETPKTANSSESTETGVLTDSKESKQSKQSKDQRDLEETVTSEHLTLFRSLQNPISQQQLDSLMQFKTALSEALNKRRTQIRTATSSEKTVFLRLLLALGEYEKLEKPISDLVQKLGRLNPEETTSIKRLKSNAQKLQNRLQWPGDVSPILGYQQFLQAMAKLEEIAVKNTEHQKKIQIKTRELICSLKEALEQGNSTTADQIWERIVSNINITDGSIHNELSQQSLEFKARLDELRDWKNFAATQKKNELIAQMQHLSEKKMDAPSKAKNINKLHKEWKQLGKTSQNEKLWRQFKKSSDLAYEPCKEYFRQQKEKLVYNFQQRKEICAQLETLLATLQTSPVNVADLMKIESKARADWKLYAPVEHSKIKKLQKQFYGLMEAIRKHNHGLMQENAQRKETLVQKAIELAAMEDIQQAMNQAKSLQSQWKEIGSSSFKLDRKYWEAFRGACDKIFAKRDLQKNEHRSEIDSSLQELESLLKALDEISSKDDDLFRDSRTQFSTLQRDFHNALIPAIKKERGNLKSRFDVLVRNIEQRFKKLPDKKLLKTKAALLEKIGYCEALELKLLECTDDSALATIKNQIEIAQFEQFNSCGNPQLDKSVAKRLQSVLRADKISSFNALLQTQESKAKNLVIELEILANIESPEPDSSLRMQVQLNQLKNNFGKMNETRSNRQIAHDTELEFLCTGPMGLSAGAELGKRLQRALEKLV